MVCWKAGADRTELRVWWSLVWPASITHLLVFVMELTDAAVLGHFQGGDFLPSASSAILVISLTNVLFQRGPCGAISTLSANAYGASQDELAGRRLQLALVSAALLGIIVSPTWWLAGDILGAFAGGDLRPREVDLFGRWRLIGIVPNALSSVLSCWLGGRKITKPGMFACTLGCVLNLFLNYVLIYGCFGFTGLGFVGSPLATAISRWTIFITLVLVARKEILRCWPSSWRQSFTAARWREFLKLSVPMTMSGALEEFNMQLTAIFALHFGSEELATHNCMGTMFMLLSALMVGSMYGTSTRVSHHIVAGDVAAMKRVVRLAFQVMFSWSVVVMVACMCLQDSLGAIFSSNLEVRQLSGQLSFLLGTAYCLMAFFYVSFAVLEGIAKPTVVMIGFVIGCYMVGLPLTYTFGYKVDPKVFAWWPHFDPTTASGPEPSGCGLLGLWFGLACGYLVTSAVAVIALLRIRDWDAEVRRARDMAELQPSADSLVDHDMCN